MAEQSPEKRTASRAPTADASGSLGVGDVFRLGIWVALGAGLLEVGLLLARREIVGRPIHLAADFFWRVPAAEVIVLSPLILILMGLAAWKGRVGGVWTSACFFFVGALSVLSLVSRLHGVSVLLLSAGSAAALARAIGARPWFRRISRRTALPVLAALVLVAGTTMGLRRAAEAAAIDALPPPTPDRPNILLLVLDTVSSLHLSAYGYERPTTPHLAERASEGVRFEVALSTAPWTLPSHASLFTGRWPHATSTTWGEPLDGTSTTLAERLAQAGYVTGGFVGNQWVCSYENGLDRGFHHYEDYTLTPAELVRSSGLFRWVVGWIRSRHLLGAYELPARRTADHISGAFLDWLDEVDGRPFFAFLNFFDAHSPYLPPAPFDTLFDYRRERRLAGQNFADWSPTAIEAERNAYDAAISALDDRLDRLFDQLEERGVLDETIVVLTSDHGEEFGERGFMRHGHTLYRKGVQVPLIIWGPKAVPAGTEVSQPVSIRDVPATIVDLAGISGGSPFRGRSLRRFWTDPESSPDAIVTRVAYAPRNPPHYPVSQGSWHSLVWDGWRYIRSDRGHEELYDFVRDTLEASDLSRRPEQAARMDALEARLAAILGRDSEDDRLGGGR